MSVPTPASFSRACNASRAGLRSGDVILALNGVALSHPDQVFEMLSQRVRQVEMIVQRGAQRITMRFRG